MIGYETTFVRLFEPSDGRPRITRIEIPIFQRDYAQGRDGRKVGRIRGDFLEAIRGALLDGRQLALDFVYGEVREGVLRPLDGQQRLTTLFLLHWYLAAHRGRLDEHPGKAFAYETRPSAREFCGALSRCGLEGQTAPLSAWLRDRPWYRYTWDNDPTIQSMLRMLDEIDIRFRDADAEQAWARLVDLEKPAVTFHLLPVEDLRSAEQLYIKMNSRGRALTEFETFKARIEQILDVSAPARSREFAEKVDGAWSRLLWRYRGDDSAIDDEFQRYFEFVIEVCEWRDGGSQEGGLVARAARMFGGTNPRASEHLTFLFSAFDTWVEVDVAGWFATQFSTSAAPISVEPPPQVVLFEAGNPNLFAACCRSYGIPRGKGREFALQLTLLLYGVVLHRINGGGDPRPRLRVLRNLVVGSTNEVREEQMPALLAAVEAWILEGRLDGGGGAAFNSAQVEDELRKAERLAKSPGLTAAVQHLEDNQLIQGRLSVFDIEAEEFPRRAAAFHRIFESPARWPSVTGALLACGDYSRWKRVGTSFQLGSPKNAAPWRSVFTQAAYVDAANTRAALERLLDDVVGSEGPIDACLAAVQARWLAECERVDQFGWRYYLVKYPLMRQGLSGLYIDRASTDGFTMCMLDYVTRRGWHRDPYLSAVREASGTPERFLDPKFLGYEADTKGLVLERSYVRLTSAVSGFNVSAPSLPEHVEAFEKVCANHGVVDGVLPIPQAKADELLCDKTDRVQRGASFVRDLLEAGF